LVKAPAEQLFRTTDDLNLRSKLSRKLIGLTSEFL
jgi:hypothetical protein